MVGQSLGAGDPARAVAAVRTAALYNVVCLTAVGIVLALLAPTIAGAYVVDPEVAQRMCVNLRLLCASYPFFACGMVFASALNGAGDSRTAMRINLLCFWLWEIPLAWLLAKLLDLETTGVCTAIVLGLGTYAGAGALVFRLGHWQRKRV
jgi:Na+-driven multidrug efflux pump